MGRHAADIPLQPIIVIGSRDWELRSVTDALLVETIRQHPNPLIITGGCPTGAELHARELASEHGWQTASMRDEEMGTVPNAIVLGFIRNNSEGATQVIDNLRHRFWTRVIHDTSHPRMTGWESR